MKPSDPRSWRITVRARSNGVDLRLRATNILPGGGGGGGATLRLRLRLRLRRLFLSLLLRRTVEPQNGGAGIHNARPRSKLLGFLGKLFRRHGGFLRRRSSAPLGKRSHDRSVGSVFVEWIGAAQQLCQDVFSRNTLILENRWMMLLIIFVLLSVLIFKVQIWCLV